MVRAVERGLGAHGLCQLVQGVHHGLFPLGQLAAARGQGPVGVLAEGLTVCRLAGVGVILDAGGQGGVVAHGLLCGSLKGGNLRRRQMGKPICPGGRRRYLFLGLRLCGGCRCLCRRCRRCCRCRRCYRCCGRGRRFGYGSNDCRGCVHALRSTQAATSASHVMPPLLLPLSRGASDWPCRGGIPRWRSRVRAAGPAWWGWCCRRPGFPLGPAGRSAPAGPS